MSWSVNRIGTKDKVRALVEADFDKMARNYAGTEEERDVLIAKERTLSAIDGTQIAGDSYAPEGYGVAVECNGSRSTYGTSIHVGAKRIALVL